MRSPVVAESPTEYVLVRPGPELIRKLKVWGAHLHNEVVLRIAHDCRLKPTVVRRALRGGLLKREHWELLAVYLRLAGLSASVKARWAAYLKTCREENLRLKQEQKARGGYKPSTAELGQTGRGQK